MVAFYALIRKEVKGIFRYLLEIEGGSEYN